MNDHTFKSSIPDAYWTPLEIFSESAYRVKPHAVGSSCRIEVTDSTGEPCEIEFVVLLHVLDGMIIQEDLYFKPDSLVQCRWAE